MIYEQFCLLYYMSIQERIRLLELAKNQKDAPPNNVFTTKPNPAVVQPLTAQQSNQFSKPQFLYTPAVKPEPAPSVQSAPGGNVNNFKKMFEEMASKKQQTKQPPAPPPPALKQVLSHPNPPKPAEPPVVLQSKDSTSSYSETSSYSAKIAQIPVEPKVIPPGKTFMTSTAQPHRNQPEPAIQKQLSGQGEDTGVIKPSQLAGKGGIFAMFENRLANKTQENPKAPEPVPKQEDVQERTQNIIGRMFTDYKQNQASSQQPQGVPAVSEVAADQLMNRGVGSKKNKKKKIESFGDL